MKRNDSISFLEQQQDTQVYKTSRTVFACCGENSKVRQMATFSSKVLLSSGGRRQLLLSSQRRMTPLHLTAHRFFSFQNKNKPQSPKWKDPGTLSIWLGWSILALIGIDQGLQYQQSKARKAFLRDVQAYQDPPDDADHFEWMTKETLYKRRIQRVPEIMDGYKTLHNVKVGDVVEVVQDKAGPDDVYSVCRMEGENGEISVGWFPTVDLEEVVVTTVDDDDDGDGGNKKRKPWYKIW